MLGWFLLLLGAWLVFVVLYRVLRGRPAPRPVPRIAPVRRRALPREDEPHVLYRFDWMVWRPGRPIYFGITNDLPERTAGHARKSWWWKLAVPEPTVIGRYPSRSAALLAEKQIIKLTAIAYREKLTNTQHNPYPVRRRDVPRRFLVSA